MEQEANKFLPICLKFDSQKPPVFIEKKNLEWVLYGEDNLYPQYLIDLYKKSTKHNAIINGKVNYIIGGGIVGDNTGMTVEKIAILDNWITKPNPNEDLNQLIKKIVTDLEIFGGFAMEAIWSKSKKNIAELNHIDFSKLRVNKNGKTLFYSKDWSKKRQDKETTGLDEIPVFDEQARGGRQIIYYKQYSPSLDVYPIPEYLGAVPYIEMDFEIANFHYNNIKHGFWGGMLLNFSNGVPPIEKQEEIEKQITNKFVGTDNANRMILNFSDGKDRGIEFQNMMPNDFDKLFLQLNDQVQQEIFSSHRVTSATLFGISTPGALGQRNEMLDAFEIFKSTYVRPKQDNLESFLNYILSLDGIDGKISINEVELFSVGGDKFSKVLSNLTKISPLIATKIMETITPQEMRQMVGIEDSNRQMAFKGEDEEKKILGLFSMMGRKRDDSAILKSVSFEGTSQEDDDIMLINFANEVKLNDFDKKVLAILKSDGMTPIESIAKALGVSVERINKSVTKMANRKLIDVGEEKGMQSGSRLTPTERAEEIIDEEINFELGVEFTYEKNPINPGPPIIPTTRDFCRTLINMDKMYTREEIESISLAVDRDVWTYRGGWWMRKGGNVLTPHCRHIWQQHIVRKRK